MTLVDLDFEEQLKETNFPDLLSDLPATKSRRQQPKQQLLKKSFQQVSSFRPNGRTLKQMEQQQPRRRPDGANTAIASATDRSGSSIARMSPQPSDPPPSSSTASPVPSATSLSSKSSKISVAGGLRRELSNPKKDDDDLLLDALLVSKGGQQAAPVAVSTAARTTTSPKRATRLEQPKEVAGHLISKRSTFMEQQPPKISVSASPQIGLRPPSLPALGHPYSSQLDPVIDPMSRDKNTPAAAVPMVAKLPIHTPKQHREQTRMSAPTSPRSDYVEALRIAAEQQPSPEVTASRDNALVEDDNELVEGLFLHDELLCIIPRNLSSVSSLREGDNDHTDDALHRPDDEDEDQSVASTEAAVGGIAESDDDRVRNVKKGNTHVSSSMKGKSALSAAAATSAADHSTQMDNSLGEDDDADDEVEEEVDDDDSESGSGTRSLDGAQLLEKAKDRIARQHLLDEMAVLKSTIERKNEELESLHGQLRRAVATKCDLVIAHNELEKTHAQAIQRKESNLLRMKQANIWLLEAQSIKEKELINEIVRLTDLCKETEQKHRDELDDWERMHRNEMLEKDFEIAKLSEELRRYRDVGGSSSARYGGASAYLPSSPQHPIVVSSSVLRTTGSPKFFLQ